MNEADGEYILRLSEVSRRFGDVIAVDRLSLTLERGEFVTLLGPSGCGKTTALRLIAGFERPDGGRIRFEGDDVTEWNPQRRAFGMVFQNYALFPHLNVFENVAFGLRTRKIAQERLRERVSAVLEIVDLSGYGQRAVQALSGGQQQRVALARALAIEPPLLLLDEPLSNLDQELRVRTRAELRDLVKALGITALFVTHDQEEAFDLSDRIAVMDSGQILQIGTPQNLYQSPENRFVAGFVGRANLLSVRFEAGFVHLREGVAWPIPDAALKPLRTSVGNQGAAGPCVLVFRPEELRFVQGEPDRTMGTPLPGRVRDRRFRGAVTTYQVEVDGVVGASDADRGAPDGGVIEVAGPAEGPEPGSQVLLQPAKGANLHLFPADEDV